MSETKEMKRVEMLYPTELLTRIDTHKREQAHTTRTAAILDLIRRGLESYEKERNQ